MNNLPSTSVTLYSFPLPWLVISFLSIYLPSVFFYEDTNKYKHMFLFPPLLTWKLAFYISVSKKLYL